VLVTPTRRLRGYLRLKTMHVCECCSYVSKQFCIAVIQTNVGESAF